MSGSATPCFTLLRLSLSRSVELSCWLAAPSQVSCFCLHRLKVEPLPPTIPSPPHCTVPHPPYPHPPTVPSSIHRTLPYPLYPPPPTVTSPTHRTLAYSLYPSPPTVPSPTHHTLPHPLYPLPFQYINIRTLEMIILFLLLWVLVLGSSHFLVAFTIVTVWDTLPSGFSA